VLGISSVKSDTNQNAFHDLPPTFGTSKALEVPHSREACVSLGRQKLFGNVGYRLLEANVQELLRAPKDEASWC
jgi:hypothetical protein